MLRRLQAVIWPAALRERDGRADAPDGESGWKEFQMRVQLSLLALLVAGLGLGASHREAPDGPPFIRPAPQEVAARARLAERVDGLRIPFVPNRGQAHPDVAFQASTFAGTLFVTGAGEMVYALPERGRGPGAGVRLTEALVDARRGEVRGEAPSRTVVSTFRGSDPSRWGRGLPSYERVSLGEVYDGIQLTLQARGRSVEKLFDVRPGADPERIRVRVDGARRLSTTAAGQLAVATERGEVRFSAPVAFQEVDGRRTPVEVAYAVRGEEYGFRLGPYDRGRALVIDPLLVSTFLGGNMEIAPFQTDPPPDFARAIALDAGGHVYVGGSTEAHDFPGVDAGSADSTFGVASNQGFVVKLSADLSTILAATFLGGDGIRNEVRALAIGADGAVYAAGVTRSTNFPGVGPGSAVPVKAGIEPDGFVAKLDADLTAILAATYVGDAATDEVNALALGPTGTVYVAGRTESPAFPGIGRGSADAAFDLPEAFVVRLNGDLTAILAATFLGGSGFLDEARALAIDGEGRVYVAGQTDSPDFPGIGPGSADGDFACVEAFVVRLNAGLSVIQAATYLGGEVVSACDDTARALVLDGLGHVYVGGETGATDFPGVSNFSADDTLGGTHDGFVAKLDTGLSTVLNATLVGGNQDDDLRALALDSKRNLYAAGRTASSTFPGVNLGSADGTFAGASEAFVVKLDPDLSIVLAATFLGGAAADEANGLVLDGNDNIYVAGTTGSFDFPGVGPASADPAYAAHTEGFAANLSSPFGPDKELLDKLKGLVDSCDFCPPIAVESLHDRIDHAVKHVEKGQRRAAIAALDQFVRRTERFVRSGLVSVETGRRFAAAAEAIIAGLGSP
jgi:hypothetical protein